MKILDLIEISYPKDGYEALRQLSKIEEVEVKSQSRKHVLVVVDSISGCLTPNFLTGLKDCNVGAYLVGEVGMVLRRLARIRRFAVLVTNGVVSSSMSSNLSQPALGSSWRAPDVRVYLQVAQDLIGQGNEALRIVCASLRKHHARARNAEVRASMQVNFGIATSGIVDIPTAADR